MEPPTGKRGTQENPPKQERAPRRRFGQLGWRLGGRERSAGPPGVRVSRRLHKRAARGKAATGSALARSARLRWRYCATAAVARRQRHHAHALTNLRVDLLPEETLCTASKEEGSWADGGACVPAAERSVGSMEYATPAAGSTLAIKRFGPTCQVKQGHLVTSEHQPMSSHLLQPQST